MFGLPSKSFVGAEENAIKVQQTMHWIKRSFIFYNTKLYLPIQNIGLYNNNNNEIVCDHKMHFQSFSSTSNTKCMFTHDQHKCAEQWQ